MHPSKYLLYQQERMRNAGANLSSNHNVDRLPAREQSIATCVECPRASDESDSDSGEDDELDALLARQHELESQDLPEIDRRSYFSKRRGQVTPAQVGAIRYKGSLQEARARRDRAQEQNNKLPDRPAMLRPICRDTLSTPDSVYSSHPVETSPRLIRLLRACGPTAPKVTDDLEFSLIVVSMDDSTVYDAISYACGDSNAEKAVYVNGTLFYIRKTLYEALVALREGRASATWTWVDEICINQSDSVERGHQVTLMGEIFAGARTVHIWLGPAVTGSRELFDPVKRQAGMNRADWLCTSREEDSSEVRCGTAKQARGNLKAMNAQSLRSTLVELSRCQWWRRLWTVQEVVNAVDPIVHWGEHTISFVLLFAAIADLFYITKILMIDWSIYCSMSGITEQLEDLHQLSYFYINMSSAALGSYAPGVYGLLEGASLRRVRLEHDRVYALLGLLNGQIKIVPDYDASVEDVYEEATISFLRHERTFDILALAGSYIHKRSGLPSWALDFGYGGSTAPVDLDKGVDMSTSSQVGDFYFTNLKKGILSIRGRKIDHIRLCSETGPKLRDPTFFGMDPLEMQSLKRILRRWHEFAWYSTNGGEDLCYFILDRPRWHAGYLDTYQAIKKWLFEGADDEILNDVSPNAMSDVCRKVSTNRAFITRAGYFGIGVEPARAGDVIVSFTGSTRHFIVREVPLQTTCRHQLIGQCRYDTSEHRMVTSHGDERIDLV